MTIAGDTLFCAKANIDSSECVISVALRNQSANRLSHCLINSLHQVWSGYAGPASVSEQLRAAYVGPRIYTLGRTRP